METEVKIEEAREILRHNVRYFRKSRNLTQAALAERMGIAQPNIAQIEAGKRSPSFETLISLADALGVAPDLLLRSEVFSEVA